MNIFQDYYESKLALELLAKEVEEKKSAVTQALLLEPGQKIELPGVKFHLKRDFIYQYSEVANSIEKKTNVLIDGMKEKIKGAQTAIKSMKALEIEDGTAELIDTKYSPVMTVKKS